MATFAAQLDSALRTVAPIIGVSIGRRDDKTTWRIDFDPAATDQEKALALSALTAFDATQAEANEVAEESQIKAEEARLMLFKESLAALSDVQFAAFLGQLGGGP